MSDKNKTDINSRNMKVKATIPKGVIALVDILPALNKTIHKTHDILMEIIQFGNDVALHDTKAKQYYNIETQDFDVTGIFKNWDKINHKDPSHKIAKDVCSIIKEHMFE